MLTITVVPNCALKYNFKGGGADVLLCAIARVGVNFCGADLKNCAGKQKHF